MKLETFELERNQSVWENRVKYNLSESGVHPLSIREILDEAEIEELIDTELLYCKTNGSDELRQAISGLYPGATPDQVMVTSGTCEANFLSILTLLEPGDELLYMIPNYLQIQGIARSFGIVVKPLPLREELGWRLDLDHLHDLVSHKTKMIAVCHPNNPTGAILDEETIEALRSIAAETGAYLLSDEVYRGAELSGVESPSFYRAGDENVIINSGLSKAYGMPGLRIGWTLGPVDYVERVWANHDYTSICVATLSDRIAAKALQPHIRKTVLARTHRLLNENIERIGTWAKDHDGLLRFIPPQAGAFAYFGYDFPMRSAELVKKLRDEAGVFVVAGEWFGTDRHIRIGHGEGGSYLMEALDLLGNALTAIHERSS